jgi:hypothetical protein
MQTFAKNKIALAVGSALLVAAGAAQAAAPALRTLNPAVVHLIDGGASPAKDTDIRALYSTAGVSNKSLTLSVALTSAVTTAGEVGDIRVVAGDALGTPITTGLRFNSTTALNNVNVYTGTLSATTARTVTAVAFTPDTQATQSSGKASITVTLGPLTAPAAYRMNGGNLEYTANNGSDFAGNPLAASASASWAPVKIDIQSAAATATGANDRIIYTDVNGTAGYTNGTDLVASPITLTVDGTIKSALAPTPLITTRSTAGAALIDGVVVNTSTPITLASANIKMVTTANAPVVAATDITSKLTVGALSGSTQALTFTAPGTAGATGIGWISAAGTATAGDAAAYAAAAFNTGVTGATVPVSLDGTATAASYTTVVNNGDGNPAKLDDSAGTSKTVTATALTAATVAKDCVAAQGAALILAGNTGTNTAAASKAAIAALAAPTLTGPVPAACTTAAAVTAGVAADTAIKAAVAALGGTADQPGEDLVVAGATTAVSTQNVTQDAAVATATIADAAFPAKFADPTANGITDGAAPVVTAASYTTPASGVTDLALTFSEGMNFLGGTSGQAIREIAENVFVNNGITSLAASNLNAAGTLAEGLATTTLTDDTVTISGVQSADVVGKTVTVTSGIGLAESNDAAYITAFNQKQSTVLLDTHGVVSNSSAVEGAASAAALTPTLPPLTIAFGGTDTTAAAFAAAAEPTKIDRVVVTFKTGKGVQLNPVPAAGAATTTALANLAQNIVITVTGMAAASGDAAGGATTGGDVGAPVTFQVHPSTVAINGLAMTLTLPTNLIYQNISRITSTTVAYQATGASNQLLANATANGAQTVGSVFVTVSGAEPVALPYALAANTTNLLTQSIVGNLTSATTLAGDQVQAYVAKWVDAPATTGVTTTVGAGVLNGNPIVYIGGAASDIETNIDAELGKVKAAAKQVDGVSEEVKAYAAATTPIWYVLNGGKAYVSATSAADAAALATYGTTAAEAAIKLAASAAGYHGAAATGASGSGIKVDGTSGTVTQGGTQTSAMAAIQSGVAAALAAVVETANIPPSTIGAATSAAQAQNATVASVVAAVLNSRGAIQVQSAQVDVLGKIIAAGGVVLNDFATAAKAPDAGGKVSAPAILGGQLTLTKAGGTTAARGLVFVSPADPMVLSATAGPSNVWGAGVIGTVNGVANSFNLLLGADTKTAEMLAKTNRDLFVLIVHRPAAATLPAEINLLTSADPFAANYMPFVANLTDTNAATAGKRTNLALNIAKLNKVGLVANTSWALYGLGDPAVATVAPKGASATGSFPRRFVGLKGTTQTDTVPTTFWTSDLTGTSDMALTMNGGAVAVATELGDKKATLSTIQQSSFVTGANALAWKNDVVGAGSNADHLDILQNSVAPAAGKIVVRPGWSLVTVPSAMTVAAGLAKVDAVIKVGSQVSAGYTWIKSADAGTVTLGVPTTAPALTAGEAVFVYSAAGGAIN